MILAQDPDHPGIKNDTGTNQHFLLRVAGRLRKDLPLFRTLKEAEDYLKAWFPSHMNKCEIVPSDVTETIQANEHLLTAEKIAFLTQGQQQEAAAEVEKEVKSDNLPDDDDKRARFRKMTTAEKQKVINGYMDHIGVDRVQARLMLYSWAYGKTPEEVSSEGLEGADGAEKVPESEPPSETTMSEPPAPSTTTTITNQGTLGSGETITSTGTLEAPGTITNEGTH